VSKLPTPQETLPALVPATPAGTAVTAPGRSPSPNRGARLKGRHKAAVLLVSLGAESAAEIFRHLRPEEIEPLSLEMAKLQNVEADIATAVLDEVVATLQAYDSLLAGGVEYAREVLERALGPDRADEIMARLESAIEGRPFEFLRRTPPEQIANFLMGESPQAQALVVANLHHTAAAQVLASLDERAQVEVAVRLARMGEISPEVVRQVEEVMRTKVASIIQQEFSSAGGVKSLAQILNQVDRPTERNVLDALTELDAELSAEVRRLLFVFEDIVKLDDRSIQLVLREADQKDLALALRGVSEEVKRRILQNMSERGAQMLLEEIQFQPPQRKRLVEEAQSRIVGAVRRLEESGALVLSRGEGDDVL
jgi:flagellar motor switch protein FliG